MCFVWSLKDQYENSFRTSNTYPTLTSIKYNIESSSIKRRVKLVSPISFEWVVSGRRNANSWHLKLKTISRDQTIRRNISSKSKKNKNSEADGQKEKANKNEIGRKIINEKKTTNMKRTNSIVKTIQIWRRAKWRTETRKKQKIKIVFPLFLVVSRRCQPNATLVIGSDFRKKNSKSVLILEFFDFFQSVLTLFKGTWLENTSSH